MLQQTPIAVIGPPSSLNIVPPETAETAVIDETAVVVNVGRCIKFVVVTTGTTLVVEFPFELVLVEQEYIKAIPNNRINIFFIIIFLIVLKCNNYKLIPFRLLALIRKTI